MDLHKDETEGTDDGHSDGSAVESVVGIAKRMVDEIVERLDGPLILDDGSSVSPAPPVVDAEVLIDSLPTPDEG